MVVMILYIYIYIDLNVITEEFLSRQKPNLQAFLTGIAVLQVTRLALCSYVAFSEFSRVPPDKH